MKKLLKNKKGFTLVELLAVIVVLAIIAVIATTQINSTIKRSRAGSLLDSAIMVKKNAKLACANSATSSISISDVTGLTDYDTNHISITKKDNATITVSAVTGGKYANADSSALSEEPNISKEGSDALLSFDITLDSGCTLN